VRNTKIRMTKKLHILVLQQNRSGESKISGMKRFGKDLFDLDIVSIDTPLPAVIDDSKDYLPTDIEADLVLDFLKHPDLSHDLEAICRDKKIPVIASGKKLEGDWSLTPPT
jgi:hypothetical protein